MPHAPRIFVCAVLAALAAVPAVQAQNATADFDEELYYGGQRRMGRAVTGVAVQHYTYQADRAVDEVTVPLYVFVPLGQSFGASMRVGYASASGDGLEPLSGLTDLQLGGSYQRALGPATAVLSLGLSLPTGAGSLTPDEFGTAVLLAQNEFAFEAPVFGQGFRASPGFTVAVPLGNVAVLGLGASYQLRTGFQPFEGEDESYVPADETLLTAGLDLRLGVASALSVDLSYAFYGSDTFADRTFEPGNRFSVTSRLVTGFGAQRYYLLARYRTIANGTTFDGDPLGPARPTLARLETGFRLNFGPVGLGLLGGARYYGDFGEIGAAVDNPDAETVFALADHQLLFDLGVSPSVVVGSGVRLNAGFTYTLGLGEVVEIEELTPFSGFRFGAGLEVGFAL